MGSVGDWLQVILGGRAVAWTLVAFLMIFMLRDPTSDGVRADRRSEQTYNRGVRNSLSILWTGRAITGLLVVVALPAAGSPKGGGSRRHGCRLSCVRCRVPRGEAEGDQAGSQHDVNRARR